MYITCDYIEVEPNDDYGPTDTPLVSVYDLGTLDLSSTLVIQGSLDEPGPSGVDTYRFQLPSDVGSTDRLSTSAVWSSGTDALDLWLWDEESSQLSSTDTTVDEESGIEVTDRTDDEVGYVGVEAKELGTKYYLFVTFIP